MFPKGAPTSVEFTVDRPGGIQLEEPDRATANVGLAMGLVGTGLVFGGALLALSNATICHDYYDCPPDESARDARVKVGVYMFLGGLAMAPVGWVMFAANRNAQVLCQPKVDVRVAITPARDGATIGLSGGF